MDVVKSIKIHINPHIKYIKLNINIIIKKQNKKTIFCGHKIK